MTECCSTKKRVLPTVHNRAIPQIIISVFSENLKYSNQILIAWQFYVISLKTAIWHSSMGNSAKVNFKELSVHV